MLTALLIFISFLFRFGKLAGQRLNNTIDGTLINPEGTDTGVIAIITIIICTTIVLVLTAVSLMIFPLNHLTMKI